MAEQGPRVVLVAGPNGAGKSTVAPRLLQGALKVDEFVNADVIARGLSAFAPERVAIQAGKLMLARIRELAGTRARRPLPAAASHLGYGNCGRQAISSNSSSSGCPAPTPLWTEWQSVSAWVGTLYPRQRYVGVTRGGIRNSFRLYRPLSDRWYFYENSGKEPILITEASNEIETAIEQPALWCKLNQEYER